MPRAFIGMIGGSGLYQMEGMTDVEEVAVQTPFGNPSDVITVGKVEGVSMGFLPRTRASQVKTWNDHPNVGMMTLNRKMDFVRDKAIMFFLKEF